jgi:curved DNA-binding protein CbpA
MSDAAATEAETRTRAAFHDAQREQTTAPAPKRASNGAERLRGAAETLGVNVDATRQELRRAFLRKALDAHPDKGGSAADFTKLQGAYRDMDSATDDTRRHAAQEIRDARDVTKRARRDATHNTGRAEEGLTEAVARARAEAERRAVAAIQELSA